MRDPDTGQFYKQVHLVFQWLACLRSLFLVLTFKEQGKYVLMHAKKEHTEQNAINVARKEAAAEHFFAGHLQHGIKVAEKEEYMYALSKFGLNLLCVSFCFV